jgi:hypothetical protein
VGAFTAEVTVEPTDYHYVLGYYGWGGSFGSGVSYAEYDTGGNRVSEGLMSTRFGGTENLSLAASGGGTILAAGQDNAFWEIGGAELNKHGVNISGSTVLTSLGNHPIGAFSPRVAGRPDAGEWNVSYSWEYNKLGQQAMASASSPAQMVSPANGSTLSGPSQAFTWNTGSGATQYMLWVGTSLGGTEILNEDEGTNLSTTVTGLPTNGNTIYVRLRSLVGGTWLSNDYSYAASSLATLTSPAPGTTLASSSQTFQWTAAGGATQYFLWLGPSPGSKDFGAINGGTNLSVTASGLPTNAGTIHARLWSLIAGHWLPNDYTYTAASAAIMTSPPNGATLSSASQTFTWGAAAGATQYYVWLGSAGAGSNDLGTFDRGTNLNATLGSLPTNGSPLYVRLWSLVGGTWISNDYSYTAANVASITSPANGSAFTSSTITFTWSAATGATQYVLWVGSSLGATDLALQDRGTNLSGVVSGLPVDGRTIFVRLWSLVGGAWQFNDYTYTAAKTGAITSPTQGSTLPATSATFTWAAGTSVSQYYIWVGTAGVGSNNLDVIDRGTNLSATINNLPASGGATIYVRLWSLVAGTWLSRDYTYSAAALAAVELPAQATAQR